MKIFQKDFYNKISFEKDIAIHRKKLNESIHSKNILVVGGAGTIGSNYIKQILNFKPSKIVVVDINENALAELTRDLRSSKLLDFNPEYITYPVNLLSHTFDKIFYSDKWHVLANFSAHKHVLYGISFLHYLERNFLTLILDLGLLNHYLKTLMRLVQPSLLMKYVNL